MTVSHCDSSLFIIECISCFMSYLVIISDYALIEVTQLSFVCISLPLLLGYL